MPRTDVVLFNQKATKDKVATRVDRLKRANIKTAIKMFITNLVFSNEVTVKANLYSKNEIFQLPKPSFCGLCFYYFFFKN